MITYVNPTGLMSMLSQAEVDMLRRGLRKNL